MCTSADKLNGAVPMLIRTMPRGTTLGGAPGPLLQLVLRFWNRPCLLVELTCAFKTKVLAGRLELSTGKWPSPLVGAIRARLPLWVKPQYTACSDDRIVAQVRVVFIIRQSVWTKSPRHLKCHQEATIDDDFHLEPSVCRALNCLGPLTLSTNHVGMSRDAICD